MAEKKNGELEKVLGGVGIGVGAVGLGVAAVAAAPFLAICAVPAIATGVLNLMRSKEKETKSNLSDKSKTYY